MPRAPKTIIDIDLSDTPYKEYEVSASSCSLGEMLALGDQPDRLRAGAGLAAVRQLVELFAGRVTAWNLEDDSDVTLPTPTTVETILSLDFRFAGRLIVAWLDAMTNVDDGLGKGSTSGPLSEVPSFPMDPL